VKSASRYVLLVAKVGLQLWTIREECDRDLAGTLRRVGELGYDGVELFQLHGHDAAQVRAWLDAAGLAALGRHATLDLLETQPEQLTAELTTLGADHLALSWVDPDGLDKSLVARIEAVANAFQQTGITFGFHNHWAELRPLDDGRTFLDLLRELPAELLWLELDLGWIWQAGADPAEQLDRTAGRCPIVHLKDYVSREDRDDVPIGDGVVGYEGLVPAAVAAGAEWLVVEEDEVGPDPFGAVERSLRAVRRMLPT
jgi:sugar phosphate isomerase/epimerase